MIWVFLFTQWACKYFETKIFKVPDKVGFPTQNDENAVPFFCRNN